MAIIRLGALRFAGLNSDVGSLPIDVTLDGAIFDATDTTQKYVSDGTQWTEFVSGTGEDNTGANVGVGTGTLFRDKIGVTLNFKSLIGGDNITVTDNADDVTITSTGTSPLTTKGDLYGFNTGDDRIPVGVDDQLLTVDSTQPLGVKWSQPIPFTAKGDLLTNDTGLVNTALPVGTNGQILSANSAIGVGMEWIDNEGTTTPTFDNVLFDRQGSISNPVGDQSREGLIQIDANNDAKVIIMKVNGTFQEVRFF